MRSRFPLWIALLALLSVTGCHSGYAGGVKHVATKFSPSVVRVRTVMDRDLKITLLKMSQDQRLGEDERFAAMEETLMASSGSGFAVARHGDETWFVTNRHVVTETEGAAVSLDRERSNDTAKVIYVAAHDDVAILSLPADVPLLKFGGEAFEGQQVLSLGFPGVRGMGGVYQVADGIVSNECFKDPIYGEGDDCLIQHTATIDHGNSGGPLVDARHGLVLGVNTYAFSRSTSMAYAAIPTARVEAVLAEAEEVVAKEHDKAWLQAQLKETVRKFVDEMLSTSQGDNTLAGMYLNDDRLWRLGHLVNRRLLVRSGFDNYLAWDEDMKEVGMRILGPVSTMTLATLARIATDLQTACAEEEPQMRINAVDADFASRQDVRTVVRCGKNRRELIWSFQFGRWQLVDYWSKALEDENAEVAEKYQAALEEEEAMKALGEMEMRCAKGDTQACEQAEEARERLSKLYGTPATPDAPPEEGDAACSTCPCP